MKIDYKNYHVFAWTKKQLERKYPKDILDKHEKVLAYLYQNGYDVSCDSLEDIEEQFSLYNNFETVEDFQEMMSHSGVNIDGTVGKKIVAEEFYDIIRDTTFVRREDADNPVIIKTFATSNWSGIGRMIERLLAVFESSDAEIKAAVSSIENVKDIIERIDTLEEKYDSGLKVISWIKARELSNVIYSAYIKMSKVKTDEINISKASNINDEIYGGIGGYNPQTGEIKCIIGSAVWELKAMKNTATKVKMRTVAAKILEDCLTEQPDDDDGIKFLARWYAGKESDDEYARRAIVTSLCFGILSLLSLKHNLSFIADSRNSERADAIYSEFKKILEYCGIEKEYLL